MSKFLEKSFSSRAASDSYRDGWDAIDWGKRDARKTALDDLMAREDVLNEPETHPNIHTNYNAKCKKDGSLRRVYCIPGRYPDVIICECIRCDSHDVECCRIRDEYGHYHEDRIDAVTRKRRMTLGDETEKHFFGPQDNGTYTMETDLITSTKHTRFIAIPQFNQVQRIRGNEVEREILDLRTVVGYCANPSFRAWLEERLSK